MTDGIKNKIAYAKSYWQESYSKELTDSDAIEIIETRENLISFFNDVLKKRQLAAEEGDFMG